MPLMADTSASALPRRPGRVVRVLVGAATALSLVALSIVPFLNPAWVRFEQDRTGVSALTGFTASELDVVAGALIGDLALWQGDFRIALDGQPVLNEREVGHMRDVRSVLWGGFALTALGAVLTAIAFARARSSQGRAAAWRAVAGGAWATVVGVLAIGAFAILAFPVFFELFHRLFFSAGTYLFDPTTERLVQLFPTQFWSDTTIAIGGVVLGLSIVVALLAGRRARRASADGEVSDRGWTVVGSARPASGDARTAR
jgi:integral membrane protein (TIGR01906 family)